MRFLTALLVVMSLGLAACGQGDNAASNMSSTEPLVKVASGELRGVVKDGVASYLGVPYAASPVGMLRWMPPQPVASWEGVRDAAAFGESCIQPQGFGGPGTNTPSGNEDCLFLNIWTPADAKGKSLPVMVWVHGGAYIVGSGAVPMTQGTGFAKQGAILVTINYRLGNLGFFAHPAIVAETPDGEHGNYAFMDQRAALQWVHDNIAVFGGDPDNVTLFGQSAGGTSVGFLLTMPSANGLYQKAIIESGSIRSSVRPLKDAPEDVKSAEDMGQALAAALGLENATANDLRALPAEKLVAGETNPGQFMPGPIADGTDVKGPTYQELAAGNFNHVPVMLGGNSFEVSIMRGAENSIPELLGDNLNQALRLYDGYGSLDREKQLQEIAGDVFVVEGARQYAESLSKAGVPTYLYHFDYVASFQRDTMPGTGHIFEIPFVFDTVDKWSPMATDEDKAYAKKVSPYWVAFAKTGDPNGDDRPNWPQYNSATKTLMYFGPKGPEAKENFEGDRLDFLDGLGVTMIGGR